MKIFTKNLKILFLLTAFLSAGELTIAADITTTAQGGKWSDKTTWIGGIIPTQNDNVIIASTVTANGQSYTSTNYPMKNLTVTQGGKIIREKNSGGFSYLTISGNLVNNGEITDYNDYFDITLSGNLVNNGVLKPRTLTFAGQNQQISGSAAIEAKNVRLNMTDEFLEAVSALYFKNAYISSTVSTPAKKLKMNNYSLNLTADSIRYDNYYGTVYSSSEIAAPIVFEGTGILNADYSLIGGTIYGNVTVKSPSYAFFKNLTIEGNLLLDNEAKVSSYANLVKLTVNGNFSNYADLNKDSVEVRSVKFAPRSMNLYVYGNTKNHGSTGITTVYPVTNGKTILLEGNYDGAVYIKQSENSDKPGGKVVINNEVNISGKLDVYADLEISNGGALNLLNKILTSPVYVRTDQAKLINNGKISRYHRVNNSWSYRSFTAQEGMFADFQLREWSERIEGVDVSVFNNQTYPGLPGTIKRWWRINPVGTGEVKNFTLKLFYNEALLNGQKEENLNVYRSTDNGETWEVVSVGEFSVIDTALNTITIGRWDKPASMMSEFGDFVISSGDGSVPVPSNIIVNLTGSNGIRLGAPNRYTVHVYNSANTRVYSLLAAVTLTDEIVFKQVEMPTKTGKDVYPIESIGSPQDDIQLFYIPYLESNEEYSFDVIVVGVNKGTKSATDEVPEIVAACLKEASGKDGLQNYMVDKINNPAKFTPEEEEEWKNIVNLTDEQYKQLKEKEGKGGTPLKTVVKHSVELASRTNPLTSIAYKIGSAIEFVSQISDTYRRRVFYWFAKQTDPKYDKKIDVVSGKKLQGEIRKSWDPNEKMGLVGYAESNYISGAGKMYYTIAFENKKEATAPAYRVQIIDTLATVFDPETVKFGATSHSGSNYNWKVERNGNVIKWDIEGIELPPNITPPEGEGFVTFSAELKKDLPSGTNIENVATIIFDINPPIQTNTWTNIIDKVAPQTIMNPINYSGGDTLVTISCTSTDNSQGSGINRFLFFTSVNNGPFTLAGESFQNSMDYTVSAIEKNSYRFYALAIDNVENMETKIPQIAELKSFPVSNAQLDLENREVKLYPNPASESVILNFFTETESPVVVTFFSPDGKVIKKEKIVTITGGNQIFKVDLSQLNPGIYFVNVAFDSTSETFKLIRK